MTIWGQLMRTKNDVAAQYQDFNRPAKCCRKNIEELFAEVERKFNMEHACECPEWCVCWKELKKKYGVK